jgi:hypothetical protein
MENKLPNFPVQSQSYIASVDRQVFSTKDDKKPNLKQIITTITIILFLLISLPIIVYLLTRQSNTRRSATLAQTMNSINITPRPPTVTPATSPTPTLKPVATNSGELASTPAASLKTYANLKYAYSVDYPLSWHISEFTDKTGAAFASTVIPVTTSSQEIKVGAIAKVDNNDFAFADYVKSAGIKEFKHTSLASIKTVTTASGVSGYQTTWTDKNGAESLPITYFEIANNKDATIELFLNKKEDLTIYQQIVSSFKFAQ